MPLVTTLIKGTEFRRFLDFATPAFFDVMPVSGLFSMAKQLVADYSSRSRFEAAVDHRRRALEQAKLGPQVAVPGSRRSGRPVTDLSENERRVVGHAVLELYFHQLFDANGPTLLDLSLDRFGFDAGAVWTPSGGHLEWPDNFRRALEDVYRAFYQEGAASLAEALQPLGLAPAADIFKRHFGSGDQRAVVFEVPRFIEAFHQVFLLCKREEIRLDPAFLGLGIYLATMYETLQAVGVPLDVRGCFENVVPARKAA